MAALTLPAQGPHHSPEAEQCKNSESEYHSKLKIGITSLGASHPGR